MDIRVVRRVRGPSQGATLQYMEGGIVATQNELQGEIEAEVRDNQHTTPFSKVSAIVRAVSRMFDGGLRIDADSVVATAKTVWETVVVPYDVPYVPGFIEVRLEAVAWSALERALREAVEAFEAED